MRALATFCHMLAFCVVGATAAIAQEPRQPPPSLGWTEDESVDGFVYCSVAMNAGTLRWIMALNGPYGPNLPVRAEQLDGAKRAAEFNMRRRDCPVGPNFALGKAVPKMVFLMKFHAGAVDARRQSDALADCFAKKHPSEASKFIEDYDRSAEAGGLPPGTPQMLIDEFFGIRKNGKVTTTGCQAEFSSLFKEGGNGDSNINIHDFYVRMNWLLRAQPYFERSALQTAANASTEVR